MVFDAAWAEAEEKYGELLETCDQGTKCREEITADLKVIMIQTWQQVIDSFKSSVKNAVSETRNVVTDGWKELVQC